MNRKEISVVFYGRRFVRDDWRYDSDESSFRQLFLELQEELDHFDIVLHCRYEETIKLDVRGYGDLLNTVRLRSPQDGIGNLCLGHIIGSSANCDLLEDIRRGVNRVAFAPETIPPEEENKRVCHNCGCGC